MGTLSGLDFAPRTRPRRTGSRPLGWWPWLLAFVLLATVLLGLFRKPLADQLWPQTRAQALRAQAAQALADRKSVVWGKSVSVREDLGGRRLIQTKNTCKCKLPTTDYKTKPHTT